MDVQHVPLEKIYGNPNNPNPHSSAKIETLAANIEEFGLLNPITVKRGKAPNGDIEYGLIAGEGRLLAYRSLAEKNAKRYYAIPANIVSDSSAYKDWGRRLSENKLRSYNWIAECKDLANMKDHGKTAKELGAVFGYVSDQIGRLVAVGQIPELIRLNVDREIDVKLDDVIKYVLPLRIRPDGRKIESPVSGTKGFQQVDYSEYNYDEVHVCIGLLVSGELTRECLPTYSADRRLLIQRRTLTEFTQKEISERDEQEQKKIANLEAKIAELEKSSANQQERLKKKLTKDFASRMKQISQECDALRKTHLDSEDIGQQINERMTILEEERDAALKKVETLGHTSKGIGEKIELEMTKRITTQIRNELEKQIQAEKNETASQELDIQREALKEKEKKNREQLRNLARKQKEIEVATIRLDEQRHRQEGIATLSGWLQEFKSQADDMTKSLKTANTHQYWEMMGQSEIRLILPVLAGFAKEMRQIETIMAESVSA